MHAARLHQVVDQPGGCLRRVAQPASPGVERVADLGCSPVIAQPHRQVANSPAVLESVDRELVPESGGGLTVDQDLVDQGAGPFDRVGGSPGLEPRRLRVGPPDRKVCGVGGRA